MNAPHEDAVLNFDLDFLHPTTNNIPGHALLQLNLRQVKKRIIRVNALHRYCISLKLELTNKNKELELTKKKWASTTQEYTQTSLEYKEALENYSKCERDCQILQNKLKDCQDKYYEAVNNVEAGRSHVLQLQQLVKQHDRKIELLQKSDSNVTPKTIRERLERELLLCKKAHKKDLTECQNNYNKLLKELQEAKYSNEKLQEQLSAKNAKCNNEIAHDFISHDEHSENEDNISDDCSSGFVNQDSSQNKLNVSQRCPNTKKDDIHIVMNSDFKNDVVSVDTGCGSSLASSLNSPDFVFSPINGESFEINRGNKLVNMGTSPILLVKMTDTATSPSPVKMIDVGTSPIKKNNKTYKSFGTQTESVTCNNTCVSPISTNKDITNKIVSSPVQTLETLPEMDMLKDTNNQKPRVMENIPLIEIHETQEKQCLELNNSDNTNEDCTTDNEIAMILNTMRFNHKLITPIPKSPKKSVPEDVRQSACQDAAIARDLAATAKHEAATAREDIAKTREENKKNSIALASLRKDMFYVKRILKSIFTRADAKLDQNLGPLSYDLFKNVTNVDFNYEASNPLNIGLDKSDLIENQTMPECSSDSQIEINLERIFGTEPIENSKITLEENRVLPNTQEMDNCTDQSKSSEVDKVMCLDNSIEIQSESPTKVPKKRGVKMIKKLTYLGKYRKKCELRKYKIRSKTPPLRKPRMKPKPIIRTTLKKTVKKSGTSITLNDKDVYAKAVKVMAEFHAKSSKESIEPVMNVSSEQIIDTVKDHHDDLQCDQNTLSDITSPKSIKPATVYPKVSVSSPNSFALLRSPNKSPSAAVTSPTTNINITIPRCSSRSSEDHHDDLQCDQNTLSDITSPKSINPATVSPNLSVSSPNSFALLRSPNKSPSAAVTSPTKNIIIPRRSSRSSEDHHDDLQCDQNTMSDMKSSKSINKSVKPATSPKFAASSPKSLLPSPSKSTYLEVTSPTMDIDITIPRRSSRSSVLAASFSPTAAVKAPTSASPSGKLSNMTAPLSPIPAITSLTPKSESPKNCTTSPSTTTSTPRATRRSLRYSSNSSIKSLEACTPTVPTITTKPMTKTSVPSVTTRSRVKCGLGITDQCTVELSKDTEIDKASIEVVARKRKLSNSSDTQCKRVLRSTQGLSSEDHTTQINNETINQPIASLEVFDQEETSWNPKESILCVMIQKYAKKTVRRFSRNLPDAVLKSVSNKIETYMLKIKENPCVRDNNTMHELVEELQKYDYKSFVSGLIKYLTNPDRKMELFGKSSSPPAPQMTRYEAVMLYVIRQLKSYWHSVDIVDVILSSIEHTIFKLNRTPDFDVVESVSHFYALVCRYFRHHSRLKVFMLDSMYCILFKSVPLIKQCLEVHPHIIPLAHMSAAKTSLVTIFVYLLHFYKCDDTFNRVQEIRNILVKKYYYQISEWNETKMLDLVGNSIIELKDNTNEQKMLRIAIIILGKRHGAKWTQNNIIKKLLQIIEKENTLPEHVTAFCVSLIGPLMKPYPADMKVHCEIVLNKLVNIMDTTTSQRIEEAALSSMILMGRHNFQRVNEILLSKKIKAISPEIEETICNYIRMRPLNIWKKTLPKISLPT